MISGTGGLIKLRWSLSDKGKSGGIRTLYVDFMKQEKIYIRGFLIAYQVLIKVY